MMINGNSYFPDTASVRQAGETSAAEGTMIRTGRDYREGLRDGREVWIDGERVEDPAGHPALKPIVDIRARIYDMQHEAPTYRY
jgi:hypothetical protein